ncbi:SGNH hydrolase [Bimuria novae-zelandiae CBS 107.79]|uniref:SGNH hydrolase n=1 Tax=Bimuria novae-zelandiae CBS 107.79 TaxID=1447943 RepID=A0A6A5V5E8_9PLEO|nr:SGNH hydrolase [Bimuria novae-zelandiae CBS 107.79]
MSTTWDKILLFGDSITQDSFNQQRGFAFSAGLQHEYIRRLDVINRGFSGYTSRQALKILPHVIPSPSTANIRLLVVFLGANDSSLPGAENKQHVPLPEYVSNLEQILKHPSVTAHNPKIVLIAPAPIDEHLVWDDDKTKGRHAVSRKNAVLKQYSEAAVELGDKLGVPVVNLWKAFMAKTGWKAEEWKESEPIVGSLEMPQNEELVRLLSDGLHFNPAGYQLMLGEFLKVVREKIPDLAPENVPLLLPLWNDAAAWEVWDAKHK